MMGYQLYKIALGRETGELNNATVWMLSALPKPEDDREAKKAAPECWNRERRHR